MTSEAPKQTDENTGALPTDFATGNSDPRSLLPEWLRDKTPDPPAPRTTAPLPLNAMPTIRQTKPPPMQESASSQHSTEMQQWPPLPDVASEPLTPSSLLSGVSLPDWLRGAEPEQSTSQPSELETTQRPETPETTQDPELEEPAAPTVEPEAPTALTSPTQDSEWTTLAILAGIVLLIVVAVYVLYF